ICNLSIPKDIIFHEQRDTAWMAPNICIIHMFKGNSEPTQNHECECKSMRYDDRMLTHCMFQMVHEVDNPPCQFSAGFSMRVNPMIHTMVACGGNEIGQLPLFVFSFGLSKTHFSQSAIAEHRTLKDVFQDDGYFRCSLQIRNRTFAQQ